MTTTQSGFEKWLRDNGKLAGKFNVYQYFEDMFKGNMGAFESSQYVFDTLQHIEQYAQQRAADRATNCTFIEPLVKVIYRLHAYYEYPEEVAEYLLAEHPQLCEDGKPTPAIDRIFSGNADEVLQAIQRMDDGVYL